MAGEDLVLDANELDSVFSAPPATPTPEGVVSAPGDFKSPTDLSIRGPSGDTFSNETAPMLRNTLQMGQNIVPIVGPVIAGVGDLILDDDQIAETPYEDTTALKTAQKVGRGPDGKIVYDLQAVRMPLRTITQLLFDNAQEKVDFLKSQLGDKWEIAAHPHDDALGVSSNFAIKRKGDDHWGVLEPGEFDFKELIQDAVENVDTIAQTLGVAEGPLMGALTAGGIQAVRQSLKKLVSPTSKFDYTSTAIDTAAGALPSFIGNKGKEVVTEAGVLVGKAGRVSKETILKGSDSSLWQRIKNLPSKLDSPEWKLREYGGNAKHFNDFQKESLTSNIDYLQKASPEFVEANAPYTLKGKYTKMKDLLEKTGQEIGEVYKDPLRVVNVDDILNSESFTKLNLASDTRVVQKGQQKLRVNAKTQKKIAAVRKDALEQLATLVLPEGPSTNNLLNLYRKGKLVSKASDLAKKLGAKTDDEMMSMLLRGKQIPMSEAWMMKIGNNELLKYGQKKSVINSVSTARKYIPDALNDAIKEGLFKQLGADAYQVMDKVELFHQLIPLVEVLSNKVASNTAEQFNPLKTMPGWMLSNTRFTLALGRNLLQKPVVTTALRKGITLPKDAGIDIGGSGLGNTLSMMGRAIKAGQFLSTDHLLKKQLLPRDGGAFFDDPSLINKLSQIADPDQLSALINYQESGDKQGFAEAYGLIAEAHADEFEASPYKSMIEVDGKKIIPNYYDREKYRQDIERMGLPTVEKYKALQAINRGNEMIQEPFKAPKMKFSDLSMDIESTQPVDVQGTSTVSRVASALKKTEVVELTDGTERQDYSY